MPFRLVTTESFIVLSRSTILLQTQNSNHLQIACKNRPVLAVLNTVTALTYSTQFQLATCYSASLAHKKDCEQVSTVKYVSNCSNLASPNSYMQWFFLHLPSAGDPLVQGTSLYRQWVFQPRSSGHPRPSIIPCIIKMKIQVYNVTSVSNKGWPSSPTINHPRTLIIDRSSVARKYRWDEENNLLRNNSTLILCNPWNLSWIHQGKDIPICTFNDSCFKSHERRTVTSRCELSRRPHRTTFQTYSNLAST